MKILFPYFSVVLLVCSLHVIHFSLWVSVKQHDHFLVLLGAVSYCGAIQEWEYTAAKAAHVLPWSWITTDGAAKGERESIGKCCYSKGIVLYHVALCPVVLGTCSLMYSRSQHELGRTLLEFFFGSHLAHLVSCSTCLHRDLYVWYCLYISCIITNGRADGTS